MIRVLVVDDDGRGFAEDELELRSAEGHVGLRAQAQLAADLGGQLTVRSLLGTSPRLVLRLPAPLRADVSRLSTQRTR